MECFVLVVAALFAQQSSEKSFQVSHETESDFRMMLSEEHWYPPNKDKPLVKNLMSGVAKQTEQRVFMMPKDTQDLVLRDPEDTTSDTVTLLQNGSSDSSWTTDDSRNLLSLIATNTSGMVTGNTEDSSNRVFGTTEDTIEWISGVTESTTEWKTLVTEDPTERNELTGTPTHCFEIELEEVVTTEEIRSHMTLAVKDLSWDVGGMGNWLSRAEEESSDWSAATEDIRSRMS